MVEGRHFRRDWASADDVGHRAAAQNLSDINAMGGTARHLTIGLAAPADLPVAWALDFARGFAEECASVGCDGRRRRRHPRRRDRHRRHRDRPVHPVARRCARAPSPATCSRSPVVRAGPPAASRCSAVASGRRGCSSRPTAARSRRTPRASRPPRPGATALIDISDGLLAEAGHIADASGVAIDVRRGAFEIPEPLQAVGAALGADPMQFILGGGDDHALLATFPDAASVPAGWQVIGEVREGEGVTVDGGDVRRPHRLDPLLSPLAL